MMFTRSTFRRSRGIRLLAATTAAVTALAPGSITASADPVQCQEQVLDLTNDRVLDTSKVTSSAAQLSQTTGADVFVRAFQSTPGDSAAVWWRQAYPECPAWLATDGKNPNPMCWWLNSAWTIQALSSTGRTSIGWTLMLTASGQVWEHTCGEATTPKL
ncbi:Uncharacterised protein [Mycobacteroides abscessus]|nr:Uncharacterised protein [Mycobacteroides abscessus]